MPESPYGSFEEAIDNAEKIKSNHSSADWLIKEALVKVDIAGDYYKNSPNSGAPPDDV